MPPGPGRHRHPAALDLLTGSWLAHATLCAPGQRHGPTCGPNPESDSSWPYNSSVIAISALAS
jgi:hypothetical protein